MGKLIFLGVAALMAVRYIATSRKKGEKEVAAAKRQAVADKAEAPTIDIKPAAD